MKNLLFVFLLLGSFSVFADDCTIDNPDGCDGTIEATVVMDAETPATDCDISDPECPMPEIVEQHAGAKNYTAAKAEKALVAGCFSFNRLSNRYGVGVSVNRVQAALSSLQRCRIASGFLAFACQRPLCNIYFY